jgi:hypothetical protein
MLNFCLVLLPGKKIVADTTKLTIPVYLCIPMYQCCQMVCFQTKNPNSGKFWRALEWKMLVYLWSFGIFSIVLVYCVKKNPATLTCAYNKTPNKLVDNVTFLTGNTLCSENKGRVL